MVPLAITVTSRSDLAARVSRDIESVVRKHVRRKLPGRTFRLWRGARPKLRHRIKRWIGWWIDRWSGQRFRTLITLAGFLLTLGYILFESCWPHPTNSNNADVTARSYEIPTRALPIDWRLLRGESRQTEAVSRTSASKDQVADRLVQTASPATGPSPMLRASTWIRPLTKA